MKRTIRAAIAVIAVGVALYSNAADRKGVDIETLVETIYLGDTDSFIELKERAKSENADAQLALARLYNVGRNKTQTPESSNALADIKNYEKCKYWLKKSADAGNGEAAKELGCLYLNEAYRLENYPNDKNMTEDAVKYLEMAAVKGRNSILLGNAYARLARKTGNKEFFKKAYKVYEEQDAYGMMPALFISIDGNPDEFVYENLDDLEKLLDKFSKSGQAHQDKWFVDMLRKLEAAKERMKNAQKESKQGVE